jgi:hypothetical protein
MRFIVQGVFLDRPPADYEAHAASVEAARHITENACIVVSMVEPADVPPCPS